MTFFERGRIRRRTSLGRARLPLAAMALGLVTMLLVPGSVAAHPLGNFTINHYAGLRVEPDRILLDIVIDQAEIPAFQARLQFDADGDGEVSEAEVGTGRVAACQELAPSLDLRVNGKSQTATLTEAGLAFPPGAGGLSTMRIVCGFEVVLGAPLASGTAIAFADRSFVERIGWREIVVEGSGVTVVAATVDDAVRTSSLSARLTEYPADLVGQPPVDTEVMVVATPGGPLLPGLDIPDGDPIETTPGSVTTSPNPATVAAVPGGIGAAVPGGIGADEVPAIFRSLDLTPVVLLVSLLTAAALGAGHALTPGHGKTLIAAYLVGSRGTPAHAAGLGLSVALSHTLGILVLAGLVVGAQNVLPPDLVIRTAPILAAGSIVAIGGWMLYAEARRRWQARTMAAAEHRHERDGEVHDQAHDHGEVHDQAHDHGEVHDQAHDHGEVHDHEHHDGHVEVHHHGHDHDHGTAAAPGEHRHGGRSHDHLPAPGATVSWRSLFVLGLAGGLIPSANALVILLVSIAAGRPAFGFVLVLAFGLGMAAVMGGIGLAMTIARGRLDRVSASSVLGRATAWLPLAASVFVLSFGVILTIQAV